MFDGRVYQQVYEEACTELKYASEVEEIRGIMERVEWTLNEAIVGVFIARAVLSGGVAGILVSWILDLQSADWVAQSIFLVAMFGFIVASYWLSRFVFWFEISRHVRPRLFGDPFGDLTLSD